MQKPVEQPEPANDSRPLPSSNIPETNQMTTTAPKPFVFVLMPFSKEFHDVYQLGIRQACVNAGTYCERVDEQVYDGTILERVYNQISNADFIIADMTGRNPNVFYEVGYAHALNKRVILLTQRVEDIPFDLSSYPHIVYDTVTYLHDELCRRLSWLVSQPSSESTYFQFPLKVFSAGQPIEKMSEIKIMPHVDGNRSDNFDFGITVLNSPERLISTITFRIGVIVDPKYTIEYVMLSQYSLDRKCPSSFTQQDSRIFYLIDEEFHLLPGGFQNIFLYFRTYDSNRLFEVGESLKMTLRILTEAGINDLNLSFKLT
jgi:hypothetical protein